MRTLFLALAITAVFLPKSAIAHGINGHIWVTDGATAWIRDCDLARLLSNTDIRPILQIGAAFPDSGYALDVGREYAETAHWEPFIEAYLRYLRTHYGPPFTSDTARKLIAFWMGAAAHGMEDEVFDTLFLQKSLEVEGTDQDLIDPGTDFMLIADGHTRLKPQVYLPGDDLVNIFAMPELGVGVTVNQMKTGMFTVKSAVINLVDQDASLDDEYRPKLPWTSQHYLDPLQPGSLAFEKFVIGPYLDALWHRLHTSFRTEDVVVQTVPMPNQPLLSTQHTSVDSWMALMFGYGVKNATLSEATVKLLDAFGGMVPIKISHTRWGGHRDTGRIVVIQPQIDLAPDAQYTAVLAPGIQFVDDSTLKQELRFTFRTTCDSCPAPQQPASLNLRCENDPSQPNQSSRDTDNTGLFGCVSQPVTSSPIWLVVVFLVVRYARKQARYLR